MDKITVKEIEEPIRIEEAEDIIDIIAENITDRLVDGFTQKLLKRDAKQTRNAVKRLFREIKPPFLP